MHFEHKSKTDPFTSSLDCTEGNLFESNIVAKGLLIQKQYGWYHCEAKVRVIDVKSHDEGLRIEVTISCPNGYGLLDGKILCGSTWK